MDVSRGTHRAVPHTETRARDVGVEGRKASGQSVLSTLAGEVMPVPQIEEFGSELNIHSFANLGILDEAQIVIVVAKSP